MSELEKETNRLNKEVKKLKIVAQNQTQLIEYLDKRLQQMEKQLVTIAQL